MLIPQELQLSLYLFIQRFRKEKALIKLLIISAFLMSRNRDSNPGPIHYE